MVYPGTVGVFFIDLTTTTAISAITAPRTNTPTTAPTMANTIADESAKIRKNMFFYLHGCVNVPNALDMSL